MFAQIFLNLRIFFLKISPLTRIQIAVLNKQRSRLFTKGLKEELNLLQLEYLKITEQIQGFDSKWRVLNKSLRADIEKLSSTIHTDEMSYRNSQNFTDFVAKITASSNVEAKITALEAVVAKLSQYQKFNNKQSIITQKNNQSQSPTFEKILLKLVDKLNLELRFWKLDTQLEDYQQNIFSVQKKIKDYS